MTGRSIAKSLGDIYRSWISIPALTYMVEEEDGVWEGGHCPGQTCRSRAPVPCLRRRAREVWWPPSWAHTMTLLISALLLLCLPVGADLGVYSDSEDQRLTIRISPLPTDSGFPYALYRQVQLRCAIDTEPAIDIESCGWRFNNGLEFLENTNKYTLYKRPARGIVHSLTMILTINGVTPTELGLYTCEGKNSAGLRKSATVELDLIGEDTVGIKEADLSDLIPTTEVLDDIRSRMTTADIRAATTTPALRGTTALMSSTARPRMNVTLYGVTLFILVFTRNYLIFQN